MSLSVRYMGSKRSLAPAIATMINGRHPRSKVLDVFAGMCAVAGEVSPRHAVLTNDIHAFAEVVAQALFVAPTPAPTSIHARSDLRDAFHENELGLLKAVGGRVEEEASLLARIALHQGWRNFKEFTATELEGETPTRLEGLRNLATYKDRPKTFPYCLTTAYFASAYFGVQQAIAIDSLRYAIDQAPKKRRAYYLCALLQAMSSCAAAPGHFAQFLIPRDRKNTLYIARMRQRSILERFYDALDTMPRPVCKDRASNETFCADATQLLTNEADRFASESLVIYADPPYSKAQYSRYYHVLETIVRYDYPESEGKGRYRDDRHQTDFSQVANVADAIDNFVAAAASTGSPLYLSYPSNGLLTKVGESLEDILETHYPVVELAAASPLKHSTMGGAPGTASIAVIEDVYYAGWKR